MELRKIVLIVLIILIASYLSSLFGFTFGIRELLDNHQDSIKECESLGGYGSNMGAMGVLFGIECIDYDEDGFKFYWIKDKNGRYYKTR